MISIVICGGHLSPALAVIEKLLENKNYRLIYAGRKQALEGDRAESLEYSTVKKLKVTFISVSTARLQRAVTIYTLFSLLKFPIGLLQSFLLLLKHKPKIILSFGGYVALPVCLSARMMRIPIITHEQTAILGLTNKIISRFSDVLCLSFARTSGIPKGVKKTVVTGNPVRKSFLTGNDAEIVHFGDAKLPFIYITGGSLGSKTINRVVAELIPVLCTRYRILHQCGDAANGEDFVYLSAVKGKLQTDIKENYSVVKHIDPAAIGAVFTRAHIIISRAGANTVGEILTFGIPAILIPLPWSGQNEQEKNASMVTEIGLCEIIRQANLTPKILLEVIYKIEENISDYKDAKIKAKELVRTDGADTIVKLIPGLL